MTIKRTLMRLAMTTTALAFGATMALADGAVIAVVGGKADDPFFAKVKKGIDDGTLVVQAHGGTVNYLMLQNYDNIGGDAARCLGYCRAELGA
jgi:simple sugar transport system substrate-binding protein